MDAAVRRGGVSAVVEYDYTAQEPDELDLVKGAIIHSIKQMPDGWWEGTMQATGKTGMFPDNFVRVLDTGEDSAVTLRDKSAAVNRRCKVIYSYTQVNDDELSLAVGDVIEFLGEVEEGWWRGRLKTKIGVFPSNFVVSIEPSPILASKRPPTVGGASAIKPAANSVAAAASSATKKTNRLSFHSSKEDLLSSTTTTTTTTTSAAAAAPATDEVAPSLPPKPQRDYCRVEYPYAPQNDDELELKVGDIITIISMDLPDKGWWKGELRGKVGVFPDNFVKLMAPTEVSPLNDSQQQPQSRTAKTTNVSSITATATSFNSNSSTAASKVFIKKSGSSSSSNHSTTRKDSFGSRDSLNDILSETGLPSGNVAAQRKSLENKNLDLSHAPDANTRVGLKKTQQLQESKNIVISSSSTTTVSSMSSNSSASEMRKSSENLDDKTKTPPPKLSKKPTVPSKKTPVATGVAGVAGKIFSGIKQKVETVENKLTTATSVDTADGIGSSKMVRGGLADSSSGNVVIRRAATIAVEDSDFDRVERASILTDMRAGRVKAPKRRPPSSINVIGESNNNNSVYLNGSSNSVGGGGSDQSQSEDSKLLSSDDNSTGEEPGLAKPKPREWDKIKAPWMEELKASQVKKKTSPSVEPRTVLGSATSSIADRTSKLLAADESKISSSNATSVISTSATSTSSSSVITKVQSSTISSSIMQQSMTVESSQQSAKKELNTSSVSDLMTKSMSSKQAPDVEDVRARPNSLSIRNRSISPSLSGVRNTMKTSASPAADTASNSNSSNSNAYSTAAKSTTSIVNNHHENNVSKGVPTEGARVGELEKRVEKLEGLVQSQQRIIDELVRKLREEAEQVRLLRGELDKYAQCVTQV